MSERIHLLAQRLTGKTSLEEVNLDEIRELTRRYPFYAAAQFLLLQKLKAEDSPDYNTALQKAVLYYHNPLEFEYFISSEKFNAVLPEFIVEPELTPEPEPSTILPEPVKEAPPSEGPLAFEPYHTVDYFASQGIKLSQTEEPKDKFGMQLKSFTEWLRTMKRLPATEMSGSDPGSEKKVQNLAQDSVHNSDVVTEAMAEVWEKQGNTQKALEVYKKLSLHNPSKKAYFAAKIDNLKSS